MHDSKPAWGEKAKKFLNRAHPWTFCWVFTAIWDVWRYCWCNWGCAKWHPCAWTIRPYAICFSLSWGGALCALANATLCCAQLLSPGLQDKSVYFGTSFRVSPEICVSADRISEQCPNPAQQVPLIPTLCVLRAVPLYKFRTDRCVAVWLLTQDWTLCLWLR